MGSCPGEGHPGELSLWGVILVGSCPGGESSWWVLVLVESRLGGSCPGWGEGGGGLS